MARHYTRNHESWLARAARDLNSARKLLLDDNLTLDDAAYHAQQCAEKALKAYLLCNNIQFQKTHDLEILLEQCVTKNQFFRQLERTVIVLNPYAVYTRYPDDQYTIDRENVIDGPVAQAAGLFCVPMRLVIGVNSYERPCNQCEKDAPVFLKSKQHQA